MHLIHIFSNPITAIAGVIFIAASVLALSSSLFRLRTRTKKHVSRFYADMSQFFFAASLIFLWSALFFSARFIFADLDSMACIEALNAIAILLYAVSLESENPSNLAAGTSLLIAMTILSACYLVFSAFHI